MLEERGVGEKKKKKKEKSLLYNNVRQGDNREAAHFILGNVSNMRCKAAFL